MPIISTIGNHDNWTSGKEKFKTLEEIVNNQQIVFDRYSILTHYSKDSFVFASYNSWYWSHTPPSNDHRFIPCPSNQENVHSYLIERSNHEFEQFVETIREYPERKTFVVTHLSPFSYSKGKDYPGMKGDMNQFNRLIELKPYAICYGHNHCYQNEIIEGVRVLNAGSDYNNPKHLILEI